MTQLIPVILYIRLKLILFRSLFTIVDFNIY